MQRTPVEAESGSSALAMGYLSEQFNNRTIGTGDGSKQTFDATDLWKSLQNGADSLSKYAFDSVRAAGKTCDQVCLPVLHLIEDKLHVQISEANLNKAIDTAVTDPKVREDMRKDLKNLQDRAKTAPLTDEQVAKTIDHVTSVLNSLSDKNSNDVPAKLRLMAARGMLHSAADPDSICQGQHPTCGVASLEHKIYVRHPDIATDMVASAALKSGWKGPDGKVIKIPAGSLVPSSEERVYPVGDGDRTYAGQLFEVVAINDIGQHVKHPMSFLQETKEDGKGHITSSHEYWLLEDGTKRDFEKPGHGVFSTTGGLTSFEVANEVYRLTKEKNGILTNKQFDDDDCPAEDLPDKSIKNNNLTDIRSAKELEDTLKEFKKAGKLPVETIVWAAGAADLTGKTADKADDPKNKCQPDHVITLDDYEPANGNKPARVRLHNQWGSAYNGWMDLEKFAKCMK